MIKKIILLFVIWKVSIFAATLLSLPHIKDGFVFVPAEQRFFTPIQSSDLIRRFANFDGMSYLKIARDGYFSSELGYFPLYPIVIKFFSEIPRALFQHRFYIITGEVISNVAFLLSLIIFYQIMKQDKIQKLFLLLLLVVLLYPTSFYFGAAYNDSLFLFFASLALYLSRKKKWILASIFGALATITRLNGLALLFLILGEYFLQTGGNEEILSQKFDHNKWIAALKHSFSLKKMLQEKIIVIFLIPIAFLAYLVYIHFQFGSFFTLFSSMGQWGQDKMVFPPQVLWRYLKIIVIYPTFKFNYWIAVLELSSVVLYCFALWYSFRKIRFSYWLFMFFSVLIPWLTGTFQGMPRYGIHLYPFFLTIALFLHTRSKTVKITYFTVSGILLLLLLVFYINGYFVA